MKRVMPSPGLIAEFKAVVAQLPRGEPRKMFGYDAVFVNGNMAAGLWQNTCVVKVSAADGEKLLKRRQAVPFAPGGGVMSAWLELSEELAHDPEELLGWSTRAVDYVATLPPKQMKKKTGAKNVVAKALAKKAPAKKAVARSALAKKAAARTTASSRGKR